MKITAQEEYGLRIILRIARSNNATGTTISCISKDEGLTTHNVAKLCRILRMREYIKSTRGQSGGYMLAKSADKINIGELLDVLGGRLYDANFCENHAGVGSLCTNSVECSIRSLWGILQFSVDRVLNNITLKDLLGNNEKLGETARELADE